MKCVQLVKGKEKLDLIINDKGEKYFKFNSITISVDFEDLYNLNGDLTWKYLQIN